MGGEAKKRSSMDKSFSEAMTDYRDQLQKGSIQAAYRGLMDYMQTQRADIQKNHPEYEVPGNLYFGYMDMTYFAIFPPALKQRRLKIAVVFLHEAFRFEVWLSGANRQVQEDTWKLLKENGWNKYKLVSDPVRSDSIVEHILIGDPDFSNLDELTRGIESGTLVFIHDFERFFAEHQGA
jgi:hypothetical protein